MRTPDGKLGQSVATSLIGWVLLRGERTRQWQGDVCFVDTWSCGTRANSFAFRNSTVEERSPERSSGHNAVSCSGPRCVGNNVVRLVQLARSVSLAASLTIIQTIVSGSIVAVVLIWMGNR